MVGSFPFRRLVPAALRGRRLDPERDPLTGLLTRQAFVAEGRARIARAARTSVTALLFVVDVHDRSDAAIASAAARLRGASRDEDVVARLGASELALFALHVSMAQAATIRSRIAAEAPHGIRPSVGVAEFAPEDEPSFEPLLARAEARVTAHGRVQARASAGDIRASRR